MRLGKVFFNRWRKADASSVYHQHRGLLGPECTRPRCSLHASRCSLVAAPFPSPPLEERARERRSLFSAGTSDLSGQQAAGTSPASAASIVVGLLSPHLSSKGGEGEPLARCSPSPDASADGKTASHKVPAQAEEVLSERRKPQNTEFWFFAVFGGIRNEASGACRR
jgi:hypothetical protein